MIAAKFLRILMFILSSSLTIESENEESEYEESEYEEGESKEISFFYYLY